MEKVSKKDGPMSSEDVVGKIFREATEELNKEATNEAKVKVKDLLKQKIAAQKVVKNIDRQIKDLELQIFNELG